LTGAQRGLFAKLLFRRDIPDFAVTAVIVHGCAASWRQKTHSAKPYLCAADAWLPLNRRLGRCRWTSRRRAKQSLLLAHLRHVCPTQGCLRQLSGRVATPRGPGLTDGVDKVGDQRAVLSTGTFDGSSGLIWPSVAYLSEHRTAGRCNRVFDIYVSRAGLVEVR
jgi:hypothetical protein